MTKELEEALAWADYKFGYKVNRQGRVMSPTGAELRGTITRYGYRSFGLRVGRNQEKKVPAHRMVAESFITRIPGMDVVNHKDGNKLNNDVSNLEWTNTAGNSAHAKINGLAAAGQFNGHAKLSDEDVRDIKSRLKSRETGRSLALEYGVDESAISQIKRGVTWGTVSVNWFEEKINSDYRATRIAAVVDAARHYCLWNKLRSGDCANSDLAQLHRAVDSLAALTSKEDAK